jgi:hypothetical protein
MEDQQSLTLRWRSFSWWGREHLTLPFAYEGSQYFIYDYVQPITHKITQDTWQRIVDAPLTLIFIMGQGVCHFLFWLYRQPTLHLWLCATYHPADYWRYMTKNHWHSIDTHFHDEALSILLAFVYHRSQYFVYDYMQPITPKITQDTWPRIVDAPLTLIFMMGQGAFYFFFWQ